MKVQRFFGGGFPEIIYKKALRIELEKINLSYTSEVEKDIYYEDRFIGKRRLDLFVNDTALVELEAILEVDKVVIIK